MKNLIKEFNNRGYLVEIIESNEDYELISVTTRINTYYINRQSNKRTYRVTIKFEYSDDIVLQLRKSQVLSKVY